MAWFLCWSFPSSSSSSSSSTPKFKYDVFLNFRGDDTRNNFTSHLLKALRDKKIETFIDDEIERGDKISPSLLKAIEESRISIVIFSKGYASSRWCLEELVMILECSKKYNQIVMPVFYGVEPIHIRNQTGDFADAFADHEQRFKDKVQAWKDVLRQAANISGWNSNYFKPESALIVKIVEDISKRLYDVYRSRHDYLVRKELGMASSSFLCWSFPSSSPSSTPKFKYDVFLSFRGDDTRNNFTSHLHRALCDKKIETFIDYRLNRGDEISPSLLKAIEESRISVVIFSKDYASSRWCLEELVKILECSKKYNQIVMPVFYGVESIHITNQTGDFADAFADHEQRFKDNVQEWKDVLRQAANFSGWNSDTIKPESALIEKIVEDILKRLNDMYRSCHDKNLVGIYSRIKQVESLLRSTGDVGRVGIWGIGGIGKTTLAQAVYDRISCEFEGSCFVESIRETSEQSGGFGLNNLRQRLVSALLGEENACIGAFTSTRLGRKRLLIVFDDVTDIRQVESLTRDLGCLGSGSRIIVTSRDKQVLRNICGEDQIYKVEDLCFNDALKLFCRYAFHQNDPEIDYMELSNGVVEKVGGFPLVLKVLGSSLFQERKEVWESAMQKLENNFDRDILEVLKINYNFSGWNSETIKPEAALIEKIVEDILKRLNDVYRSCHDRNLVGIYSRIKHHVESSNVAFLAFPVFLFFFSFFFLKFGPNISHHCWLVALSLV